MNGKLKSFFLLTGICYILIGAIGITNISIFRNNIMSIFCFVYLINGIFHLLYSTICKKDLHFRWIVVFISGIVEIGTVILILSNFFTKELLFTTYIGILLCIKALYLLSCKTNNLVNWSELTHKEKISIIANGILYLIFGSLIIILPIVAKLAVYTVFGWYFLILGIDALLHLFISKSEKNR